MQTIKLDSWELGGTFDSVTEKAKQYAIDNNVVVEFEFNGRTCLVNKNSDPILMWRDFSNSWLMDWKTIGPICDKEYSSEILETLATKTKERHARQAKEYEEMKRKDAEEKAAFDAKVAGVQIEIVDQKIWDDWKSKNTDGYGACIFEYAEGWAKLMQVEMEKFKVSVDQCAKKTSYQLGFLGITGFMYGAAVQTLAKCWKYGEDLRKWHNKEYKHEGDGVVNPAILTVG